jgi:Zn-dependent protease with chaperone function
MGTALILVLYAAAVAWCLPAPLARLTARGASPRFGLAAWLAAMVSVLASLGAALFLLVAAVTANWPRLSQAVCHEVAGTACTPVIYRSALYEAGLAGLLAVASLAALAGAWRYGGRVRRARRQTAGHATAVRIVGRTLPGAGMPGGDSAAGHERGGVGTMVLDDPRPAAYCVAGRPPVIVVTRGTLDMLDQAQLEAVLAHERAHLSGRHHSLILAARALAAAFPGVPLFDAGASAVSLLTEMRADDAAARRAGRPALIAALIAIATATPAGTAPAGSPAEPGIPSASGAALAAAAYAVPTRVERMLRTPAPLRRAASAAVMLAVTLPLLFAPPLLAAFAL